MELLRGVVYLTFAVLRGGLILLTSPPEDDKYKVLLLRPSCKGRRGCRTSQQRMSGLHLLAVACRHIVQETEAVRPPVPLIQHHDLSCSIPPTAL